MVRKLSRYDVFFENDNNIDTTMYYTFKFSVHVITYIHHVTLHHVIFHPVVF